MLERHRRGEAGLPLLGLLQAVGALPASERRKQELEREDLNSYKTLGHLLNDMEGVVVAGRMPGTARDIACATESTGLVQQGQNRYRRQVPETPGLAVVGMCFGGWMAL